LINELNIKNQNLLNKQKELQENIRSLELAKQFKIKESKKEVHDFVEKEKALLISRFNESLQREVTELSLTQLEIRSEIIQLYGKRDELQNIITEKQNIIDSISNQQNDISDEKKRLELLKLEVIKQNRQYQNAAKNIERITPDLKEITRKGGIPWPFAHNLIDELSKEIKP